MRQHIAGLLQGQDGIAAQCHVLGQVALRALVLQGLAGTFPVLFPGLQVQQGVLNLLVARLQRIGLLRQQQRLVGVTSASFWRISPRMPTKRVRSSSSSVR